MSTKRKKYTAAQKAKIALEALKGEKTMSELSGEYEIHATQINTWKRQLKEGLADIFVKKRGRKSKEDEELIEELYKKIGRLTIERDWLKKKSEIIM